MDRRKSLAIGEVGSPLRRQSIIPKQPVELNENDDEAERAKLRRETSSKSTPLQTPSNRRSLQFGAVVGMSKPQIAEGIAECIKLNAQNKINIKNAFSLNMIDYMSYIVRNRDDDDVIPNLQFAGTTLDVSAKIYGLRVDALHQDILKMSGTLDEKNTNDKTMMETNNDGDGDEEHDKSQEKNKKQKKRKKQSRIFVTVDSLKGPLKKVSLVPPTLGDSDCQTTDMLYQASLPQHSGIGLGIHLYNDTILDAEDDKNGINNNKIIGGVELLKNINFNAEVCPEFTNFDFLDWSVENENDLSQSISQKMDSDHLRFDLDSSIPNDDIINNEPVSNIEQGGAAEFDIMDTDDDNQGEFNASLNNPNKNQRGIIDSNINNVMSRITNKNLEYSYFQDGIDIRWFGSLHWKINNNVKNLGGSRVTETCQQNRKKKEVIIAFDNDDIDDEFLDNYLRVSKKTRKPQLNIKTTKLNWSEDRLLLPCEFQASKVKKLCELFMRPKYTMNLKKSHDVNTTELPDDNTDYNYNNLNDTTNYCANIEDDNINDIENIDNIDNMDRENNGNVNDNLFINSQNARHSGLIGDNLIELAKPTQKLYIQFSQRAKKLDMRKLKKAIWDGLIENEAEKENLQDDSIRSPNGIQLIKEPKDFANIYKSLPNKLNNKDAEDLSYPLAFVSLLHLANERSLKIESTDNYSRLLVSQD